MYCIASLNNFVSWDYVSERGDTTGKSCGKGEWGERWELRLNITWYLISNYERFD